VLPRVEVDVKHPVLLMKRAIRMIDYRLSEIFIYPIKSFGGIAVQSAEVTDRGLKFDRRFMLVDNEGLFLSQRKNTAMALLQTAIHDGQLQIHHKHSPDLQLSIPLKIDDNNNNKLSEVYMWDESIHVTECGDLYNEWFSDVLKTNCRLVYMPERSVRHVDKSYARDDEITSLSDGYPFLLLGQESLNLLNSKLDKPLPMNRFRPNFVFTGGNPNDEDNFNKFEINGIIFSAVKPCARCSITTIDQTTGIVSKEPLKTLAAYRSQNNKVMFGQNLLHTGKGIVSVGDQIHLIAN
jgi:hypothetical protein